MALTLYCLIKGHSFKKSAIRHNGILYFCACCGKSVWKPLDRENGGIFMTTDEVYKPESEIREITKE